MKKVLSLLLILAILPAFGATSTTGTPTAKPAVKKTTAKKTVKKAVPKMTPTAVVSPSSVATTEARKESSKPVAKADPKDQAPGAVVLKSLRGNVEVKKAGGSGWTQAREGQSIPAGATLRSGPGARALVVFPNKSVVWLKEKTTLELAEQITLMTRLKLLAGNIKIKVPHLKRKEKFEIESGGVVCGVRGTILTMEQPGEKKPAVDVLFGEVRVNEPEKDGKPGDFKSTMVTQGKGWLDGKLALLSPDRERGGIEDWTPGIPEEARLAAIREDVARRMAMRQYAQQSKSTEDEVAAFRDSQKEEDFAAGRTMTDVHGNLVRIDQRFSRPELDTWEVVNLVKRTQYNFRRRNVDYNGPRGPRLDVLRARFEFNMPMPQTLNDIPAFVEKIEELKLDRITLVTGNFQNDRVFTIGLFGERPSLTEVNATDEIDMGLYAGTLTTDAGSSAGLKWLGLELQKEGIKAWRVNGLSHFLEPDGVIIAAAPKLEWEGASGEFYSAEAKKWAEVSYVTANQRYEPTGNVMWMVNESYFIDSKGGIWTIDKLLNGDITLRTFLDDMAFETIYYTKAGTAVGAGSERPSQADAAFVNPNGDNIDLIFTPDLLVAIVKSLLNAATDVKDDTEAN